MCLCRVEELCGGGGVSVLVMWFCGYFSSLVMVCLWWVFFSVVVIGVCRCR